MTQKTKAIAVDRIVQWVRMRCTCGAQKVGVCWGDVGRRGCRVAFVVYSYLAYIYILLCIK
jgi:hypothetical protein